MNQYHERYVGVAPGWSLIQAHNVLNKSKKSLNKQKIKMIAQNANSSVYGLDAECWFSK